MRIHIEVSTVGIRKSVIVVVQLENDFVGIREGLGVKHIPLVIERPSCCDIG